MQSSLVEFSYSEWAARFVRMGIPLGVIMGFCFLTLSLDAANYIGGFFGWAGIVVFFFMGVLFLWRAWLDSRYLFILTSRYVLDDAGILVDGSNCSRFLDWSDLSRGEYFPIFVAYRLWPKDGSAPVFFFLRTGFWRDSILSERNRLATHLVELGMRERLETRWLPW